MDFSDFELKVLRYISRHKIRSDNVPSEIPTRFLKTVILLLHKKAVIDSEPFLKLSQSANDAIAQSKEINRDVAIHDFIFGVLTGIASTLLIEAVWILI